MTIPLLTPAAPFSARLDVDSPVGTLRLVRSPAGLGIVGFLGVEWPEPPHEDLPVARGDELLDRTRRQLDEYWAGERQDFDLPLAPVGTPFQRRVWEALLRIGFGRTSSYGVVAEALAAPTASRAVGAAVGRNPLAIIVPCHRVLGRDGSLTGFAGGLDRKITLLRLEGSWI